MFGLCLVLWKLILEEYFPHLRVFGAIGNCFPIDNKIKTLMMEIGLYFHFL